MEPKKFEAVDPFTGVVFKTHANNHYEENDGIPHAPAVDLPRPTVRQRVENLMYRGVDPLSLYVGSEGIDMDIPDDAEAPLTESERNYLDMVHQDLAEAAPLPDEGLPRPPSATPPAASSGAPPEPRAGSGEGGRGGSVAP